MFQTIWKSTSIMFSSPVSISPSSMRPSVPTPMSSVRFPRYGNDLLGEHRPRRNIEARLSGLGVGSQKELNRPLLRLYGIEGQEAPSTGRKQQSNDNLGLLESRSAASSARLSPRTRSAENALQPVSSPIKNFIYVRHIRFMAASVSPCPAIIVSPHLRSFPLGSGPVWPIA